MICWTGLASWVFEFPFPGSLTSTFLSWRETRCGNFHERCPCGSVNSTNESGEVPRGEKMLYSGTDPESYITDYTLVYEYFIQPSYVGLHEQMPCGLVDQLLRRNVKRFRGGLVFKAHRLLYHSTLGLRVIKKKRSRPVGGWSTNKARVFSQPA